MKKQLTLKLVSKAARTLDTVMKRNFKNKYMKAKMKKVTKKKKSKTVKEITKTSNVTKI